tara:strand:- start:381 stop:1559 length:1179 start_codon:yes stop_codon:yes gene_type:complete
MLNESLEIFANKKLSKIETQHLKRSIVVTNRKGGVKVRRGGRDFVSFSCNDYLGLSHHPKLKEAAAMAMRDYGVGAAASRLITGNHDLYQALETKLSKFKGTNASCVFGSGFLANSGIIPALTGINDLILLDEFGHASMYSGSRVSRAKVVTFRHNDMDDLERLLKKFRKQVVNCLVVTEGVFSMDGDRAPLPLISEICRRYDSWLMVDDAHGFGVLGEGRGSAFEYNPRPEIPLQMGTLSKAAGAYGAFLCASEAIIELMKNRARSLIYTTALPPAVLAAAGVAIDIISSDRKRVSSPMVNAKTFCDILGLAPPESPIVPIFIGDEKTAMDSALKLEDSGYMVVAIRPPTIPEGTSRLRIAFTSEHTVEQVSGLAKAIKSLRITLNKPKNN